MDAVELDNYELGSKGTYLDGRLQLAVGAFLMDYDGFHLSALQPLLGFDGRRVGNLPLLNIQRTFLTERLSGALRSSTTMR